MLACQFVCACMPACMPACKGISQPNERAANLKVNDRHHTTPEGAHTTCLGWDEAKTKSSLERFLRKNVFLGGRLVVDAMLGFVFLVKGHPSLKSPKECLRHVLLASWYLGGLYHTFRPIGHFSGNKK